MRMTLGMLMLGALLAGCTHIKGVVLEDPSGKPLKTAVLTVGVPEGVRMMASYPVNERGEFDFQIGPTDETAVYVYDSAGPVLNTLRHLDRMELSENMKIHLHPSTPEMMPGMNVNP